MLTEEPSDTIKNLGILTALRTHSEANAATTISIKHRKRKPETDGAADSPGPSVVIPSDKVGRLKTSSHRSTSVSSSHTRDPDAAEGAKGTAAEKSGQLFVNAEVVFKHNKKQHGMEGEGILCYIKNITGEGTKKR
jgi:SAGA-associated factor 29